MKSPDGGKALLFENPSGFDIPVAINTFGSRKRMCMALGVEDFDEIACEIEELVNDGGRQGKAPGASFRRLAGGDHDRQVVDQRGQHEIEEQWWGFCRQHAGEPGEGDRDPAKDDAQP